MTPNERTLAIRAEAAEFLLKVLLIEMFKKSADPAEFGEGLMAAARQSLSTLTHPMMDPVKSDVFAQEVTENVEQIVGHVVRQLRSEDRGSGNPGA